MASKSKYSKSKCKKEDLSFDEDVDHLSKGINAMNMESKKGQCACKPTGTYGVCKSRLTIKAQKFAEEKSEAKVIVIEKVPGIGEAIGRRLRERSISTSSHLFQEYQALGEKEFKKLIKECGGNAECQREAYHAMHDKERREQ